MTLDGTIVLGTGRTPNNIMLVGEAPGREEAVAGRPFVGKSGREQDAYLHRHGLSPRTWYRTNVVKTYIDGNPDPTVDLVETWTPYLEDEVRQVQPRLIVAVGRFAARWFLGDDVDMELVHGIAHRGGAFDESIAHRACGAVVLPIYHPAWGFYDSDARALINWDYGRVADAVRCVNAQHEIHIRQDTHLGREVYRDVTGAQLARWCKRFVDSALRPGNDDLVIALDTEGTRAAPWSVQVSSRPGEGLVLRSSQDDFARGIAGLQRLADSGVVFAIHNGMYDIGVCRAAGLELRQARLWDTMYAAYLLRLEPQGLKPLAWRWCGMRQASYDETIGDAGRAKQLDYLRRVVELTSDWPKPEEQTLVANDGTARVYKPQHVVRRVKKIIADAEAKPETDIAARWAAVDDGQRAAVESALGALPVPGLGDLPPDRAVWYAARDPDATLRLYAQLRDELARLDLTRTLNDGMAVLPVFEEMQSTGMYASRRKFEALTDEVNDKMMALQSLISSQYFSGRPFNPMSHVQVAALMRRRGLEGEKRTTTGVVSTGKKSIEHLRFVDPAIAAVIDWRECAKVRDAFCAPVLERIPVDEDLYPVTCQIKTTRVATRRLAAANPNLMQIPTRHELGRRVRDCYVAPPGQVYGAWDYSQIEMRYAAHESQDPLLCRLFNEGRDVHTETAAAVFKVPVDDVDKMKHRYPAKRAGFGILYGISGGGLYDQLRMMSETGIDDWSPESCQQLIDAWLDVYQGVADYIERTSRELRKSGVVRDYWGMIRHLPGIWADEPKLVAEAGRDAVSHKIQGGAQGMIQRAMAHLAPTIIDMRNSGLNVHWCLQIHDEVILRFDEDLWDTVNDIVVDAMVNHSGVELRVPIEAEGHKATTWGQLK